jgi:hypothetical protein
MLECRRGARIQSILPSSFARNVCERRNWLSRSHQPNLQHTIGMSSKASIKS